MSWALRPATAFKLRATRLGVCEHDGAPVRRLGEERDNSGDRQDSQARLGMTP